MTEPETQQPTTWYFEPPAEPQETLRDKFAIAALTAVMNELIAIECLDVTNEEIATRCYAMADAFLKVRGEA